MPSSQSHRSAVSIKNSPNSHAAKLLNRANDLERQLSGLSKSNDEKAARLRSHLCEVLSDLVISHPVVAADNDCGGRLWRNCFYAPIGVWRSRISREKRKHGANLASLEQSFQRFLGEAVTLYDYLVLQYKDKLVPSSTQDTSQQSTQDSSQLSQVPHSGAAIVPGLYRLYIHLGDLHRYGGAYGKAETCYENASKLAPGMGNPYNQLAVVAQMKDSNMSCVALYWYARSLLATHDSFQTSGNNLERLFTINREYLKDHARDPKPPILPPMNKKTSADIMRAQKTAASKSCLAHFVDFQFDLIKNENLDSGADSVFRNKLEAFDLSFRSLLQASAFGDALVCKMVVVVAFSIEMISRNSNPANRHLSEDLLFTMGAALGERLQHGLVKINDKAGTPPSSIRLLLPYLLICEYLEELKSISGRDAEKMFWKQCVLTGNLARELSKRFGVNIDGERQWKVDSLVSMKEFHLFRGFRPFAFVNTDYVKQEAFVPPSDAITIFRLPLSQSQSTQPPASGNDLTVAKLVRFIQFCQRCAKNKEIPIWSSGNGELEYKDAERELSKMDVDDNGMESNTDIDSTNAMEGVNNLTQIKEPRNGESAVKAGWQGIAEADSAGDVVVYDTPKGGDGPELLVPGALLAASSPSTAQAAALPSPREAQGDPSFSIPMGSNYASNMAIETEVQSGRPQPPLSEPVLGITPPPGFGAPTTQVASAVPPQQHYSQNSSSAPLGFALGQMQYPANQVVPAGIPVATRPPQQLPASMVNHNSGTVGNSVDWFGGRQALGTANPFVAPGAHFGMPRYQNPAYEADTNVMDGAALLGSGFLDSLWTNDAEGNQTKNPFATNRGN